MTYLKENFVKLIKSGYATAKHGISTAVSATSIGPAFSAWLNGLKSGIAKYDAFLTGFSSDASIICDRFANGEALNLNVDPELYVTIIDKDTADLLVESVNTCASNCGLDPANGLTITDAEGYLYNVTSVLTSNSSGIDHILLATNPIAKSVEDVMLYEKDGVYYFNNVWPTATYQRSQDEIITTPTEIKTILDLVSVKTGHGPYGTILDDVINIQQDLNVVNPNLTSIAGGITVIMNHLGLIPTGNIKENADALFHYYYDVHTDAVGTKNSIWTIINNLLESNELNKVLADAITVLLNAKDRAVAISSFVTTWANSRWQSVKDTARGIANAYHTGGFYGVARYLSNFSSAQTHFVDEDGLFTFTDNSALVPQVFTAGIVSGIIQVVGTLASIIGSVITPALGLIFASVNSLVGGIFQSIAGTYHDTYSSVNQSEDALFDMCPTAYAQTEIDFTYSISAVLDGAGFDFGVLYVPGGYILYGPGAFNNDGSISKLRLEFHPSITDHRQAITGLLNNYAANGLIDVGTIGSDEITYGVDLTIPVDTQDEALDSIFNLWNSVPESIITNDDSGYVISKDQDVREIIFANVGLFYLFNMICFDDGVHNVGAAVWSDIHGDDCWGLVPWLDYFLTTRVEITSESGHWIGLKNVFNSAGKNLNFTDLITCFINNSHESVGFRLDVQDITSRIFLQQRWYDEILALPSNIEFALRWPKYERNSFIASCVLTGIVVAITVAAIAVCSVRIKKSIQRRRAKNQARVESAWNAFTSNPTAENYSAFRSAAFKNNSFAKVFGGTKYSYNNYWETSDSSSLTKGNGLLSAFMDNNESVDTTRSMSWEFNEIYKRITGNDYASQS